jgi:hypothetical protein
MRAALEEPFRRGFAWVKENLPGSTSRFIEHHSYLFASQQHSEGVEWSDPFFYSASEPERVEWLTSLGSAAERTGDAAWIRLFSYWARRIRGLPGEISPTEQAALYGWLSQCGDHFEAATDLFVLGPILSPRNSNYFYANPAELPSDFPVGAGKVMLRLLTSTTLLPHFVRTIFDHAMSLTESAPDLARELADELLLRHYTPARELIEQLDQVAS